jgi:hypothetical protein
VAATRASLLPSFRSITPLSAWLSADTGNRIRKIKCGEERPHCSRCIKSGWNCDGYGDIKRLVSVKRTGKQFAGEEPNLFLSRSTSVEEEEHTAGTDKEEAERISRG